MEMARRPPSRILAVDDEAGIRTGIQRALRALGHQVDVAGDRNSGRERIAAERYDLVLLDVMMPDGSGIDLIAPAHAKDPDTVCIIVTGYATVELAVDAIKRGAYDFVSKPFTTDQLVMAVNQGLERRWLTLEARRLSAYEQEARELARAKEELERLDQVKSQLMLKVAHELRAPTAAAQSYLNLIVGGYIGEHELRPTLARVQERLRQTLDLVGDLLELARLKQAASQGVAEATPQSMAELAEEACELFRPQIAEKGLLLELQVDDRSAVLANRQHLRQVWNNMLSNAVKYTPRGGSIEVKVSSEDGLVVARVRDTGIGIARDDLPKLFQEFYRTDQAKATGELGTGLGLSIVKQIVESYGGRVTVESDLGKGTLISVALPAGRPAAPAA